MTGPLLLCTDCVLLVRQAIGAKGAAFVAPEPGMGVDSNGFFPDLLYGRPELLLMEELRLGGLLDSLRTY